MADRTSAHLFGTIFRLLAKNPSEENKTIAKEIFPLTNNYDFSNYQMDADDALIALDLAHIGTNEGDDEERETIIYHDDF